MNNPKNSSIGVTMDLIKNNPFRVIGVFADASEREMQKQKSMIKAYLNTGKELMFDYDFSFLPPPDRDSEAIETAFSSLQLNQSKLLRSLFWFTKGSHIDETALNHLRSGDIDKAIEIWSKVTSSEDSIHHYYSAFNNLGTLKMSLGYVNHQADITLLTDGVRLKLQLLQSDDFHYHVTKITDETYKPIPNATAIEFVDETIKQLKPSFDKTKSITYSETYRLFSSASVGIKDHAQQHLAAYSIKNIEQKIKETKQNRKNNPEDAIKASSDLCFLAMEELLELQEILGNSNYQYEACSDKIAVEVLQCSIDYFKYYQEDEDTDPGTEAISLAKIAQSFAIGINAKQRIEENICSLQEWIDDTPKRETLNSVKEDIYSISTKIYNYSKRPATIENARELVVECLPILNTIAKRIGPFDSTNIHVGNMVVNNALNMVIEYVNNAQNKLQNRSTTPFEFKSIMISALDFIKYLETMSVDALVKDRLKENKRILADINFKIGNYPMTQKSAFKANSSNSIKSVPEIAPWKKYLGEHFGIGNPWGCIFYIAFFLAVIIGTLTKCSGN